jgi:hypothetical protein
MALRLPIKASRLQLNTGQTVTFQHDDCQENLPAGWSGFEGETKKMKGKGQRQK